MTQPGEDLHELDIPADPARLPAELRLPADVNEADAFEQSQVVDLDDDYR